MRAFLLLILLSSITAAQEAEPLSMELKLVTLAQSREDQLTVYSYITGVRDAWLHILIETLDQSVNKLETIEDVDRAIALLQCAEKQSPAIIMDAAKVAAQNSPDVAVAKFVVDLMNHLCGVKTRG